MDPRRIAALNRRVPCLPATSMLAVGHSARDTFEVLHDAGVYVEAKPFAIGVRIEHPQSWIDKARYGPIAGNQLLGPAAYALSHQASNGRSVYSFCMCPGGRVVAATSEEGRVVTNGMSQYSRAEFNANSGLVVDIDPDARLSRRPAWPGCAFQRTLGGTGVRCRWLQLPGAGAEAGRFPRRQAMQRALARSNPATSPGSS